MPLLSSACNHVYSACVILPNQPASVKQLDASIVFVTQLEDSQ